MQPFFLLIKSARRRRRGSLCPHHHHNLHHHHHRHHDQECEDPSYVAALACHTSHRAANKAVATNNPVAVNGNFDGEKEEVVDVEGARRRSVARAFSLCEQASEFLEAAVRLISTFFHAAFVVCLSNVLCNCYSPGRNFK